MDEVSLPSDNILGVEIVRITIPKLHPIFSGLLEPQQFFLFKNILVVLLDFRFEKDQIRSDFRIQFPLNPFKASLIMSIFSEDISENFFVKGQRILTDPTQ